MRQSIKLSFGNGGWCRVDLSDLPCPVYIRLQPDDGGRWRVTELYMDGRGHVLTAAMLQHLALATVEAAAAAEIDHLKSHVKSRNDLPSVQMSVLASHYAYTPGSRATGWVRDMYVSQLPGSDVPRVRRHPHRDDPAHDDVPPLASPVDGLTEDFLGHVGRAYFAAVRRGERPARALAKQAGVSVRTVHSWVYIARKRGLMPPGSQGRVS